MIGDALSSPAAVELVKDFTGAFKTVGLDTVPASPPQHERQREALAHERDEDDGERQEQDEVPLREGSNIARAKEILHKEGRPLHISELLAAMGKSADKDSRAALAGSLWEFVMASSSRTRATLAAQEPLANRP